LLDDPDEALDVLDRTGFNPVADPGIVLGDPDELVQFLLDGVEVEANVLGPIRLFSFGTRPWAE
jgi:hypothetical protein